MTQRDRSMETPGSVQTLVRGLTVLEVLNGNRGLTAAEASVACRLPRTTTLRLLSTLVKLGFVRFDEVSRRYFPATRVLSLSAGFDRADLLNEKAGEALREASAEVRWPMHFSVRDEFSMQVRSSTDHASPLAVHKVLPGMRIPLLQCASGLAWLAAQPPEACGPILDEALTRPGEIKWSREQIESEIAQTRQRGYAIFRRPERFTTMVGLSVPVGTAGGEAAAVCVRFAERAVPLRTAEKDFLPRLRAIADRLGGSH
jgi:IclR family transcriptional regulator, mhp operon transcriptional activator